MQTKPAPFPTSMDTGYLMGWKEKSLPLNKQQVLVSIRKISGM